MTINILAQLGQGVEQQEQPPFPTTITGSQKQTAELATQITGAPLKFLSLRNALSRPRDFIDIKQAESELLKQEIAREAIHEEEPEALFRAIARLKLMPRYMATTGDASKYETLITQIVESPQFPQIKELLYFIQLRGDTRINGFPYLIERACRHLYGVSRRETSIGMDFADAKSHGEEKEPYVGEQKYKGTVIRIDAANFTRRTYEEGEKKSSNYFSEYFYKPFFNVLRSFPNVKFIRTIGDEIVCITETDDGTAEEFAKALSTNLGEKEDMSAHIGIGKGDFSVTITPHGKILVTGPAWRDAEKAQKKSKNTVVSTGEPRLIYSKTVEGYTSTPANPDTALPEKPQESAMHLFRGTDHETIEDILSNPNKLAKALLDQFALAACTVPEGALSLENPIERRSTCLCIKTQLKPEDSASTWEETLEKMAAKYEGKVIHFELNPDEAGSSGVPLSGTTAGIDFANAKSEGEKMGIIVFGTQGTNPFNQEERAVRCAKQLHDDRKDCVIGIECGEIHISDTSKTDFLSDAINKAVRLAFADDSKRQQAKGEEDPDLGPIRIGPNAQRKFDQSDITSRTLGFAHTKLLLKGYLEAQDVLTTSSKGLEIGTLEGKYVRNSVVEELIERLGSNNHIHILETEEGLGARRILREIANRLQNVAVVELPRHHNPYDAYEGISSILARLFPTSEDFETWLEKQKNDETQKRTWRNLYKVLRNEPAETNLLVTSPLTANKEIQSILRAVGNLAVLCPNIDAMHETSRIILRETGIAIITTGHKPNGENYELGRVAMEEAMLIAKHKLGLGAEENPPIGLKEFIQTNLTSEATGGLYNPIMVERLIDGLLEARALRPKDHTFFDEAKANSEEIAKKSLHEYQDQAATKTIDRLTTPQRTALRIAVTLEPVFTKEQLRTLLGENELFEKTKNELIEKRILRESRGHLQFVDRDLPERISAKNLMPFKPEDVPRVEKSIREGVQNGIFNVPHYLRACEKIGMSLSKQAIELTAQKTHELFESDQVLAALAICEQFIATNHSRLTAEQISELDQTSVEYIFEIYLRLISAKTLIGKNVETDLTKIGELTINIQAAIQKNRVARILTPQSQHDKIISISFDMTSRLADTACDSAYRSKNTALLAGRVDEYAQHLGRHPEAASSQRLKLRQAQLLYIQADNKKDDIEIRRNRIKQAIRHLQEIETEDTELQQEKDTLLYLAEGYRLVEKGLFDKNLEELGTYIERTEQFIKDQEEKGNRNKEWLAEIRRYLVRALASHGQSGRAMELSEINLEIASQNGYLKLMSKSLNYLLNLQACPIKNALPREQLQALACVPTSYRRLEEIERGLPDNEKQEIAGEIVASILTILESINAQIEIFKANPEIEGLQSTIQVGEETIRQLESAYTRYQTRDEVRTWRTPIDDEITKFRTAIT